MLVSTEDAAATPRPHPPTVAVIIPALNEAKNISWVLQRIPGFVDEVIVVDGLSHDGTLDVAKWLLPDVVAVRETRRGKGAAMRAGFAAARSDYLVVLDADGSMDPGEIGRFVDALDAGYDLVKGSRYIQGGGSTDITAFRSFGNVMLRKVANLIFRTRFTELCYGYFALRADRLDRLRLDADGFEIETQVVANSILARLRIVEVPSLETPRRYGQSNLHPVRDGVRILRTLVRARLVGLPSSKDGRADAASERDAQGSNA